MLFLILYLIVYDRVWLLTTQGRQIAQNGLPGNAKEMELAAKNYTKLSHKLITNVIV